MLSKIVEVYVWPLFKIDPRAVSMSQYFGKFHQNYDVDKTGVFDKKDYCIIYIDFPKFVRPFAHILKTPQSYREFLRVKHPDQDVNSLHEIHSVYSSSMEDLDQIVNSLRDKDYYFLELERKKKEKDIENRQNIESAKGKIDISTKEHDQKDDEKATLKVSESFNKEDTSKK